MKRILVLLAHPLIESSTINRTLVKALSEHEQVTTLNLYQAYPDFHIDVEQEQKQLLCHEIIVFLFPIYWYSSPSLLKEWQDRVLEYGFAYGSTGNKLHGKTLLMPIEKMAQDTGLNYLGPITLYGSRTAVEEGRLASHINHCLDKINALLSEE